MMKKGKGYPFHVKDTQKNFDARLKNIEKEVELNEKLKSLIEGPLKSISILGLIT